MNDNFHVHDLEVHQTKDIKTESINGELTIIWRDWDKIIHQPQMIYLNLINPHEIKGPHLHKKRTSYFYCLEGQITLVIRDSKMNYHEVTVNSGEPKLVQVQKGIAAAIVNNSKNISKVLVLADISWKPDDNEMESVNFNNYEWNKWKN